MTTPQPNTRKPLRYVKHRPNKYRNEPIVVDGIRFASKAEARRYGELKLLVRAGEVFDLRRQVPYEIVVDGHPICRYVADFDYLDKNGLPVTEDVKGVLTPEFKIKAKLFRAAFHREIVLVRA